TIAEGEVKQLLNCHDPDTTEARYLDVIRCKTAKLFEAGARIGAVLGGRDRADEDALAAYGMHLGTAYQLVDDVLDYSAEAEELGKNIGDDLAEGKPTLPLIYAMQNGSEAQRGLIREAVESGGNKNIDAVREAIETTGAITYTSRFARAEAERAVAALAALPESPYKDALAALATFTVQRTF
ncbi:MAG TPA: polyprenyl synthetase family protein, partial [Gammaproteobacteria bacterium]|nr:polyprenyl synthetase family protein [Gammaproteobacteria bacterium]